MKKSPRFTGIDAIQAEKKRLNKAVASQEKRMLRHVQQTKEATLAELSPTRLLQRLVMQFFSWKRIQSNPISSFQFGYKIIGSIIKRFISRK